MVRQLGSAHRSFGLLVAISLISGIAGALDRGTVPDFGLILNDDGDLSCTAPDPAESKRRLEEMVDSLRGTPVGTLAYSVGAGSDVLYYPTRVASVWGWRETPAYVSGPWGERIRNATASAVAGVDSVRIAGERAGAIGLHFVPSYRMNDSHFVRDPLNYPLTGRFWLENQDKTLRVSPVNGHDYSNLLDFAHPEVRAYRLAIVEEIVERYQDLMDGLELDFNRVQILFRPGEAEAGRPLLTEFVTRVRAILDKVGGRRGRPMALLVRIPPSVRNCAWAGLDVLTWMRRGLVDVVIPAQLMTLSHCMPVDEFIAATSQSKCRVYAAIYPRTQYTWPVVAVPNKASYGSSAKREATAALVRGAVLNYRNMGVDGFQLYNFNLPLLPEHLVMAQNMVQPRHELLGDRIYALTPAYFNDHEDTYQYRKQIPIDLMPGKTTTLSLLVGENLAEDRDEPAVVVLRLGLAGGPTRRHVVTLTLNGELLKRGRMGAGLTEVTGKRPGNRHPAAPEAYYQRTIADRSLVREGQNELAITVSEEPKVVSRLVLVECRIGVLTGL